MAETGAATEAAPAAGILDGVRVVEVGRGLAAPIVGMLLAEQGADVVRIADPDHPPADPVLDALLARGKAEAGLRLGEPAGRVALERLLAVADVVVQDLPPAEWEALGLSVSAVRHGANPGLIGCAIPAFPAGDPRAGLPGHEAIVGAAGHLYEKPFGAPRYHEFPVPSVMAGLFAANAVVAALLARDRTGRGQDVSVARYHATLFAQILQILMKTGVPRGFLPLKMAGTPFMAAWRCKDGRYAYLHITLPAHAARILDVLDANGHADVARDLRGVLSAETLRDPSQVRSIGEAKRIKAIYRRLFLTRTADEWERVLGGELCCIKVRTVDEWVRDSMAAGMSDACEVDDPVFGGLQGPGPGVTSPDRPQAVRPRTVGPGTLSGVLSRWEASPPAVAPSSGAVDDAPPLHGVRIADLSRIIAGPCAGRILAELGADVVTIQNPNALDWALSFHLMFNAGKRSVTLDFTDDEGKRRLWGILDDLKPDALIQNYRNMDVARAIGVDPGPMRARFPGIVYAHLNSYGDRGAWKDRPGFEQVVQAVSGIQVSYGIGGVPKLLPTPVIDIGSGIMGAFATLLGLYHKARTGQGAFVTTHLTWIAVLLQVRGVAAFQRERCLAAARAKGMDAPFDAGRQVAAGIARARGGRVAVAGPHADLATWLRRAGADEAAAADPIRTAGARLRWSRADAWLRGVREAGVSARVAVLAIPRISGLLEAMRRDDPGPGTAVGRRACPGVPTELTFVRGPIRMDGTPPVQVGPPPVRGADTREFLARIGVDAPPGAGEVPYPPDKPLLSWLASFVRWGYFAWRSGNI